MTYIGVDLGGTKISVARITGQECEKESYSLIPSDGTEAEVLTVVVDTISKVIDKNVKGIGIGVPSVVDQQMGIVYDVQNIPSWKEIPLKAILENHFRLTVHVNNDANCFALGEFYFGQGKEQDSFVGITIGTGIAGGVIINKLLYNGFNTGAGEFGMLPYLDQNFEHYCSGQFFKKVHRIAGEHVFNDAKAGKKEALKIYHTFGEHLGNLIIQVMYTYDPQLIILGGSVSKGFSFFEKGIHSSLERYAYQESVSNLKILVSTDPKIAVKGAAALCYQLTKHKNENH